MSRLHRPSLTEALTVMRSRDCLKPHLREGLVWYNDYRLALQPIDLSGYGNSGTLTNMDGTNWSPDGLSVNGTNENIIGPTLAELSVGNQITVAFRAKVTRLLNYDRIFDVTGGDAKISTKDGGYGWSVDFRGTTSNIAMDTGALAAGYRSIVVTADADASYSAIYADGILMDDDTIYGPDASWPTGATSWGASAAGSYGVGAILSYGAIWNRILAASEIKQLYDDSFALVRQRPRQVFTVAGEAPASSYYQLDWGQDTSFNVGVGAGRFGQGVI
jgi:hypothetical protein